MKFIPLFFVFCFVLTGAMGQTVYPDRLDGQLYVKFNPSISITGDNDTSDGLNVKNTPIPASLIWEYGIREARRSFYCSKDPGLRNTIRLWFDAAGGVDRLIEALQKLPEVVYAEHVPLFRTDHTPNDMGSNNFGNGTWHLYQIKAQEAWDISTGSADIKVAIVDDAVQTTHPDLAPNMLPGRNVAQGNNNPNPPNTQYSHGTHVAGIAAAASNNGIGVASVGYGIKIIPVRATTIPALITSGYEGITWAANNGADVINMSWGGTFGGQTGAAVVNAAYNLGVTLVAACGNDNVQTAFYPAAYTNVISVASTSSGDVKSSFSNYGTWVTVSAPGSSIRSTVPTNSYAVYNGTSMASPLVAGLCGLVLSINPDFTPAEVRNCITSSADNINTANPSYVGRLGAGRINARQAALCALSSVVQYDAAITQIHSPAGSSCNNTFSPAFILRNNGSLPLTAATINYRVNNNPASVFNWNGNLAPQTQTSVILPSVSGGVGNHLFTITISNTVNGNEDDQNTNNNSASVNFTILSSVGQPLPFVESFESGSLATNSWTIENPDNGISWELLTIGGTAPGNKAIRLPFWSYETPGQRDGLITPPLDLTGYSSASLRFDHAYRRYNQSSSDSMIIYVSTDCGVTWSRIFTRGENGSGIFATAALSTADFVPAVSDDWCLSGSIGTACYTISLNPYLGNSSVRIRFEGYNNFQNNLYLDNINITGVNANLPPVAAFTAVTGTDVCAGSQVIFSNLSTNQPSSFQWSFPGGIPSSSNQANPSVTYAVPGTYAVSLNVSNASGSNMLSIDQYLTVHALPDVQGTAVPAAVCPGTETVLSGSGALHYTWTSGMVSFTGTGIPVSISGNTTYTLTGTDANGCTGTSTVPVSVLPVPDIYVSADRDTVCPGTPAVLTASGGQSYTWDQAPGIGLLTGRSVTVLPPATTAYTVHSEAPNGCSGSATIVIVTLPQPAQPLVVSGNNVAFVVKGPQAVSGHYPYIAASTGWGVALFSNVHVQGPMAFARDNSAADSLACLTVANPAQVAGKISVVYRGTCEFGVKALNAQNAGAIACIIINTNEELFALGAASVGASVHIPVIMVTRSTGVWLRNAIASGNAYASLGQFRGGPAAICPGQSTEFAVNGGYTAYQWSDGGTAGVDTVHAPGTVTVTVFGPNGCGTPATFTVPPAEAVDPGSINGETVVVPVTAYSYAVPQQPGISYEWTVTNGTIQSGQHTGTIEVVWDNVQEEGLVSVKVTGPEGCYATTSLPVIIESTVDLPAPGKVAVRIHPNPATDLVMISVPGESTGNELRIFDATGRMVTSFHLSQEHNSVSTGMLAPGLYLARIGRYSGRFVKR